MSVSIRRAGDRDIPFMAEVTQAAYGGYSDVMYAESVPGMTPRQILEMRLEQENTTYHIANGWIAEDGGEAVGAVHAYPVDDEQADPIDPFVPGDRIYYFAPMENMVVPGSYYLNAIGVRETHRRRGVAALLMETAIAEGRGRNFEEMSLMVLEGNSAAVALYRRHGFEVRKRRPVVAHPALHYEGNLLLMALRL